MKLTQAVNTFLKSFLPAEWAVLAQRAMEINHELRLATKEEDVRIASPRADTTHSSDTNQYVPVRDKRLADVPLVLRPVTAKDKPLGYAVVLDTDKVTTMAVCERYAEVYMARALGKISWDALAASLFARQSGGDARNNYAQKQLRKLQGAEGLLKLAQPFIGLADVVWEAIRPSITATDETLAAIIDDLRMEAQG
jgi:hypothetical protein